MQHLTRAEWDKLTPLQQYACASALRGPDATTNAGGLSSVTVKYNSTSVVRERLLDIFPGVAEGGSVSIWATEIRLPKHWEGWEKVEPEWLHFLQHLYWAAEILQIGIKYDL